MRKRSVTCAAPSRFIARRPESIRTSQLRTCFIWRRRWRNRVIWKAPRPNMKKRLLALKERQIGGDREQTAVTQAHLAAIYMRAGTNLRGTRIVDSRRSAFCERKKGDERLEFALETMACDRRTTTIGQ